MKNIVKIIFLFIFLVGCTRSKSISEIEILTYFNNAKHIQIYSSINPNGYAETIYKSDLTGYLDSYHSKIDKNMMEAVFKLCDSVNSKDFKFKQSKKILYDGYLKSIQITYDNGEKFDFQFSGISEINIQFKIFEDIYKQIINDSLIGNRANNRTRYLLKKQVELSNLTYKKDSINHKLLYQF